MSDTDDKFNEELEGELGKELDSDDAVGIDSDSDEIDDFTVKVHREEYVVKRRFYDKDKALETAESLRKDKKNLVEDNIEGDIISSALDDEEDEKVDWNKLVDSGLEFYPPIADAAEKKPGEKSVGLTKLTELSKAIGLKELGDQKELEKTMVVKKKPIASKENEKVFEESVVPAVSSEATAIPAVELSEDEPEKIIDVHGKTLAQENRKGKYVLVGFVFVVAAVLFYIFMKPVDTQQTVIPVPESSKSPITRTPVVEKTSVDHEQTSTVEAEAPVEAGKVSLDDEFEKPVVEKIVPVEDVEKKATLTVEKDIKKDLKSDRPDPIVNHYPYSVHVSSYQSLEKTITAISRIKKKGLEPFTGLVNIPGKGNWYRVYIGYHETYKGAVSAAGKIKQHLREGASAAKAIWAIQVGKAGSEAELLGLVKSLEDKGYYFCKIPVAKESEMIRLLAGAYKTESEAATMINELKKDGFDPTLVKR